MVNAKFKIPNISGIADGQEETPKEFCTWVRELARKNKHNIEFFEPNYNGSSEEDDSLYMVGDKGELLALATKLDDELNGPQSYENEESFTELVQDL